jgi:hypothetical protein
LCPKDNISLHSQSITTLIIHDNKSHNSYKNEFIAVAFINRSGTDEQTNIQMDRRMNKETNVLRDEQTEAMRGIKLSSKTDKQ